MANVPFDFNPGLANTEESPLWDHNARLREMLQYPFCPAPVAKNMDHASDRVFGEKIPFVAAIARMIDDFSYAYPPNPVLNGLGAVIETRMWQRCTS